MQLVGRLRRAGITAPPDPALYTDDTQMSLAVAEALIEAGETPNDLNRLMGVMGRRFIGWKRDPTTPTRAPGATSMRGVNALERGAPWREAGVRDSKGCGSCMRVAPIGYFCQRDPESLREVARAQGWLTHPHPTADAASIGAAYIKLALDNVPVKAYPERVLDFTAGISDEFDAAIRRVTEVLDWSDGESALNHIGPTRGGGWIAEEATAMALYCVIKHPDDFSAAVILGVNIGGDSESVASIAGGIVGARLGLSVLPADWLARLENRDYIDDLTERLAQKRGALWYHLRCASCLA
jgi:ADP-ribosylglycohydrolase